MTRYDLPKDHKPFIDKYFLRTNQILKSEGLNPFVRAQVFIRKGPGEIAGIDEAVEMLRKYTGLEENGGRLYTLRDGMAYEPKKALMLIEARIQDIVELETMYLGVISAETTIANNCVNIDLGKVERNIRQIVELAKDRPVAYFGARHWRYDLDKEIAAAAFRAGAKSASTDIGASNIGQLGMGTIPHALENIYAWKYGYENAVVEATKAFDRVIDSAVPRIALIDYANKEVDDTIRTAKALDGELFGIRVDTCGENIAQGAVNGNRKYWEGRGVTVTGVKAIRDALNQSGFEDVKIMLSSGFGNPDKVKAFVEAEKELGIRLFDGLGVGDVYGMPEIKIATMDIVAVGDTIDTMIPMAKVGREYHPNDNLELILGQQKTFF